jgi:excisionase family DNA binding protein
MLRLLIKDITVEKSAPKQLMLHIRWQGGACSDAPVELPPNMPDRIRYPVELVEQIRTLAETLTDAQIAEQLDKEGRVSPKGKTFTVPMIQWVRYKHRIKGSQQRNPDELTVEQVMERFSVSRHVVYYWIERGHLEARQIKPGTPYRISLDTEAEQRLSRWVKTSSRMPSNRNTETAL